MALMEFGGGSFSMISTLALSTSIPMGEIFGLVLYLPLPWNDIFPNLVQD